MCTKLEDVWVCMEAIHDKNYVHKFKIQLKEYDPIQQHNLHKIVCNNVYLCTYLHGHLACEKYSPLLLDTPTLAVPEYPKVA